MTKLAKYVISILLLVVLWVVLASGSPIDVSADPEPTVTVNAPSDVNLGVIAYSTADKQYILQATAGGVDVSLLEGSSFTLKVKANVTTLTKTPDTLANDLYIATGEAGDVTVGNVDDALLLTEGYADYELLDQAKFVAVTTVDQQIGVAQATAMVVNLVLYQKINASEDPAPGAYTLTLTYTGEVVP